MGIAGWRQLSRVLLLCGIACVGLGTFRLTRTEPPPRPEIEDADRLITDLSPSHPVFLEFVLRNPTPCRVRVVGLRNC
jgi:hypothetical protein